MADDRIDEAIAAVVRAVDRIEAATRGVAEDPPVLADPGRLPRKPPPPSFTATDLRGAGGFAARPTTSLGQPERPGERPAPPVQPAAERVDPLEFDEPEAVAPEFDVHAEQPSHDLWHEETFYESEPAFEPPVPAYEPQESAPAPPVTPPVTPPVPPVTPPVPSYDALAPTGDDEVHELVGRIIARTQHLEDQLELARHLRFEITELVRRLAAAVERDK